MHSKIGQSDLGFNLEKVSGGGGGGGGGGGRSQDFGEADGRLADRSCGMQWEGGGGGGSGNSKWGYLLIKGGIPQWIGD